jgi:hypothetical protein
VAHPVISVFVAIDVAQLPAFGRIDKERVRLKIANIMANAAREDLGRAQIEAPGLYRPATVIAGVVTHDV